MNSNVEVSSSQSSEGIAERLARIEEKVGKPKSFLDKIKDWGGVATALIAILYSFPLGVWDRVYAALDTTRDVSELRQSIANLATLQADFAKGAASIGDFQLREVFTRGANTRIMIEIDQVQRRLNIYADSLSASHLLMLGSALVGTAQYQRADDMYNRAIVNARRAIAGAPPSDFHNSYILSESLRLRAQLFVLRGQLDTARATYNEAVLSLPTPGDQFSTMSRFNVAREALVMLMNAGASRDILEPFWRVSNDSFQQTHATSRSRLIQLICINPTPWDSSEIAEQCRRGMR